MKANKVYSSYFLLPALVLYLSLFVVPCLLGFGYSFTNWNSVSEHARFIGLENFKDIFSANNEYIVSILHTLYFAFFSTLFKTLIGLGLALLLNEGFKGKEILRGIYFMPFAISQLIVGIIFTSVFDPNAGIFNGALRAMGLGFLAHSWLVDPRFALGAVVSVEVWREIGLNMAIFLAGLQMIDRTVFEASSIDGAGAWRKFISITLPFLAPAMTINVVLNLIHGLRVFDIIIGLTGGGPGNTTQVLNTAVFATYSNGTYGLSTALGVVVFIITAVISLSTLKILTPEEA